MTEQTLIDLLYVIGVSAIFGAISATLTLLFTFAYNFEQRVEWDDEAGYTTKLEYHWRNLGQIDDWVPLLDALTYGSRVAAGASFVMYLFIVGFAELVTNTL
jgi:hypothetical protein